MAVEVQEGQDGTLEVTLTGKLTHQDYEQFVPVLERRIQQHGKLRLLVTLHDFHGWQAAALWDDIKLAIVGESAWEHGMALFCKPFTTAQVRYFDRAQLPDARVWLAS